MNGSLRFDEMVNPCADKFLFDHLTNRPVEDLTNLREFGRIRADLIIGIHFERVNGLPGRTVQAV